MRCGVFGELVFNDFAIAGPALADDVRGGVGGRFSAGTGCYHTLAVVKGVVSVNEAGGVAPCVRGFQKYRSKLREELIASEPS